MSYPPRAPMPYMNASIPPPHLIPPPRNYRNSATISSQPTVYHRPPEPQPQFRGPVITVFVGNISERVPETLLKRILAACGVVINWKRVSTFGFCEFDGPIAAMRAVRLLSELEIDGKKLVAKVDAKNKVLIEDYKEKECKNGGGGPNAMDEKTEDEYATNQMHDLLEEHKHEFDGFDGTNRGDLYGSTTTNRKKTRRGEEDIKIKSLNDNALEEEKRNLISSEIGKFRKRAEADEHRKELEKEKEKEKQLASKEKEKERERDRERKKQRESERKNSSGSKSSSSASAAATAATASTPAAPSTSSSSSSGNNNNNNTSNNSNNNAGSEVEEVVVINDKEPSKEPTSSRSRKESVVTIDVSPVRKDHKDHKDVHKDHKERTDNNKESRRRRSTSRTKERDRERERERDREREMVREREMREQRDKERERERERERDRERERERERDRERIEMRERDREREREEKVVKPVRDARREKEMEEEQRERKKAEKKAREKEAAYQDRLSNWEIREKRKTKENEKYRMKELMRQEEREKDAKRLKEFVEDYDDERDDTLYYRGRELQQRLAERVREADADSKDREKEADELAELKNKIFSGAFENPSQEYEKARKEIEKLYEPRIIINVNLEAAQRRKQETALPQQKDQHRDDHDRRKHQQMGDAFDALEGASLSVVASGSGAHKVPPSEDSMSTNDERASMADTASNASGYSHLKTSSNNNISNNNNSNNQTGDSVSRQNSESRDSLSNIHTPTMSAMESDHASSGASAFAAASATGTTSSMTMPIISLTLGNNLKKKMIETTGVFVNDDDNDENINPKRRKLVPLDYDDNLSNSTTSISAPQMAAERQSSAVSAATAAAAAVSQKIANASGGSGSTSSGSASGKASGGHKHGSGSGSSSSGGGGSGGGKHGKNDAAASAGSAESSGAGANTKKDENGAKVQDEKRRHIKSIIDRIPTQKEELFNYKLDRNEIDGGLMERKIRPWINKKIIEYIGEPEPTLVDFICSKVLAGSPPQSILDDVQMVLDEEAEVFVVKMWRLLIYELDAKKSGIAGK